MGEGGVRSELGVGDGGQRRGGGQWVRGRRARGGNAPGCTCLSTLWMYRLKVSLRLALRVFLAPVDALLAALAVFLLGAALAI